MASTSFVVCAAIPLEVQFDLKNMEEVKEGKEYSFPKEELKVLQFWDDIDAFQEQLRRSEGKKPFVFYDGPPFATGLPHYGHLLAGTLKVWGVPVRDHERLHQQDIGPARTSSINPALNYEFAACRTSLPAMQQQLDTFVPDDLGKATALPNLLQMEDVSLIHPDS